MTVSEITAIATVVIASASVMIAVLTAIFQFKHNSLTVKPFISFFKSDYSFRIAVGFRNVGSGPAKLKELIVKRDGEKVDLGVEGVVSVLPSLRHGLSWNIYSVVDQDLILPAGGSITLIDLPINKGNPDQLSFLLEMREVLSKLEFRIVFEDIYGSVQPESWTDLSWFARPYDSGDVTPPIDAASN